MALNCFLKPQILILRGRSLCQWRMVSGISHQFEKHSVMPKIYGCPTTRRRSAVGLRHAPSTSMGSPKRWMTSSSEVNCWKCHHDIYTSDQFCIKCGTIQPPMTSRNYFDILGVDVTFDQDEEELTKNFRDLQKRLHPDKFSQKSDVEREYSEHHSSLVNKSYQTLLKPLSRGLYLLELNGEKIGEGQTDMDPEFLMKIMEVNEELETTDLNVISKIQRSNREDLEHHMLELSEAFESRDIVRAKKALKFLKYYANIDEKVKEIKFQLAANQQARCQKKTYQLVDPSKQNDKAEITQFQLIQASVVV